MSAFNEHEVIAAIHRLHAKLKYREPPFSVSNAIEKLFPDVDVIGREIRQHGKIDIYAEPLPNGKRATITYRKRAHHSTQRYTCAHELAHWIFDVDCGRRVETVSAVCDPGKADAGKPPSERRADFFASEFLMPLYLLDEMVDFLIFPPDADQDEIDARDTKIQRLASRFNVSFLCAQRRVFDLHHWRQLSRGR